MIVEFDPVKNQRNIRDRSLSFESVQNIDLTQAMIAVDDRYEYGETRFVALCYLNSRLHVLCFTETTNGIRVISFRKANKREVARYDKEKIIDQS